MSRKRNRYTNGRTGERTIQSGGVDGDRRTVRLEQVEPGNQATEPVMSAERIAALVAVAAEARDRAERLVCMARATRERAIAARRDARHVVARIAHQRPDRPFTSRSTG